MARWLRFFYFAFLCGVFLTSKAHAVDVQAKFDVQANGIYRTLPQQGFSDAGSSTTDGLLFTGAQVLLTQEHWEFEIREELRALFGDSTSLPAGDFARISIQSPNRYMNAGRVLVDNQDLLLVSDLERLRASYVFSNGEVWAGRRPVSIGTLSFFKVWNKFTRSVTGLVGPTIIFGSDGLGGSVQLGQVSLREFSLFGSTHEEDVTLLETTWFNDFAEFRFLGGSWWRNTALGFAFSRTIWDWMLRGELLYLSSGNGDHNGSNSETQFGLGFDGALNSAFSLLVEAYYQSIGAMDTSEYTVLDPSRFTNFRGRYYGFANVSWQASTLWKFGIADLLNMVDAGQIIILRANHSLSDSVELVGEGYFPVAADGAEFSKRTFVFSDGNFLGSGSQVTLGLKASF